MNVACVIDSLSRNAGGLFQSVRRLVQSLSEINGAVTVFGLEDDNTHKDIGEWAPIRVRHFPARTFSLWGYSGELLPAVLESNFDVLLTHGACT